MSLILSAHSTKAFHEFLLLAVNNSEHSIILDDGIFSLDRDLELKIGGYGKRLAFCMFRPIYCDRYYKPAGIF